jgi:hypothetical protein
MQVRAGGKFVLLCSLDWQGWARGKALSPTSLHLGSPRASHCGARRRKKGPLKIWRICQQHLTLENGMQDREVIPTCCYDLCLSHVSWGEPLCPCNINLKYIVENQKQLMPKGWRGRGSRG